MALFKYRPLALGCVGLICAVALCFLLPPYLGLMIASVSAAGFLVSLLLRIIRVSAAKRLTLAVLCALVCLGSVRASLACLEQKRFLESFDGQSVHAELVVVSIDFRNSFSSAVIADLESVNGQECSQRVYLATESLFPFYIGDRFEGDFQCISNADAALYNKSELSLVSEGVAAVFELSEQSKIALLESGHGSILARLADLRSVLAYRLSDSIGGECGELVASLVLGAREGLSPEISRDFKRVGLSHVLALSGLHVSILVFSFDLFLRLLRVGKRGRIALLLPLLSFYTALTGFSPSILRAIFMLGMVYLSFFLKSDNDAVTSLMLAAAVILLIAPGAVFDLSYQLTVCATLGILSFGGIQKALYRLIGTGKGSVGVCLRALRAVLSSLIVSLSVILAVLPLQWLVFGEISLMTPLSNLLFVPMTVPLLLGGMLLLLFGGVPIVGPALAQIIRIWGDLELLGISKLARLDCVQSLRYDFVPYIFIPLIIISFILLCVDLKKAAPLALSPAILAIIAFSICICVSHAQGNGAVQVVYRRTNLNEGLLLQKNNEGIIVDVSNGSYTQLRTDYTLLHERGVSDVEALVLTHYHREHVSSVSHFSKTILLRSLYVPQPSRDEESAVLEELRAVCQKNKIELVLYEPNQNSTLPLDLSLRQSDLLFENRSTQPAFALEIAFGKEKMRYETVSFAEFLGHLGKERTPSYYELYICGAHGPVPKETIDVAGLPACENGVFASETGHTLLTNTLPLEYALLPGEYFLSLKNND